MGIKVLLRRTPLIFWIVFMCTLLLVGCAAETSEKDIEEPEETENNVEEVESDEIEVEEDKEEPEEEIEEVDETDDEEAEREDNPRQGDYTIYLGGEMIETEDKIIIHGESNLIPGSRVVGQVLVGKNVRWFVHHSTEDYDYVADTSELVDEDGNFYMEIDHHGTNNETVVAVKFHFDGQQNNDVVRHYGDRGQNLEGPFIYQHQGEVGGRGPDNIFKKAEMRAVFKPDKEMAIRQFEEPEWYDLPEDLGDPRVWLEVDEINDDGNFFYVHGRSNLIEGSRLLIRRNHSDEAETLVNPDGSFNFKFDYEYKEVPFTIEFKPHHFQWNIVEETYGAEGQKLVGNLVETNKHNNKQHIEYEVEHESQLIDVPDNVELEIDGSEVTMLVPDNVLFDFDKYDLKKDAKKTLSEISKTLENSFNKKELDIVINGHTDDSGTKAYNKELSKKRAEEVKKYFDKKLDSKTITFTTKGYGDTKPIASNDTEDGQAKNRRVEIIINLK